MLSLLERCPHFCVNSIHFSSLIFSCTKADLVVYQRLALWHSHTYIHMFNSTLHLISFTLNSSSVYFKNHITFYVVKIRETEWKICLCSGMLYKGKAGKLLRSNQSMEQTLLPNGNEQGYQWSLNGKPGPYSVSINIRVVTTLQLSVSIWIRMGPNLVMMANWKYTVHVCLWE